MKQSLFKLVTVALLCTGTVIVNADDASRALEAEADRIVSTFEAFSKKDLEKMARSTTSEAVKAFEEGVGLLKKVSLSDLGEGQKAAIVAKVADAAGEFFERLSEGYTTQPPKPPTMEELGARGNNKFVSAMKWTGHRIAWLAQSVWGDIVAAAPMGFNDEGKFRPLWPAVMPFFGSERDRSVAAKAMAKTFAEKLNLELADTAKSTENPLVLAGMKRLLSRMEEAEPLRNGRTNLKMRRMYLGLAIFSFFNPPLELFIERTTYSPLVSAVIWSAGFLYMMRVRKLDSGLDSYKVVSKMLKAIEKDPAKKAAWESCGKALENVGAKRVAH